VTDVRGAVLTAPQIEFYRSANADTTKPGELILGASTNTSQTSHTEKTTTAGVWQAQSGQGQTSQSANQTQINGQLQIGQGINTTVQVPEGALKAQIQALSQQPGQGYIADLASNPNIKWDQIKLAHDQWQYSQQGLTGAGAALLAIAVAYFTAGMGTALVGTTTTTTAATATTAAVSTTTAAGTTLATTTAATATTAATVTYSAAGAALNAGFSALASSAAVSFVNNGGDLGQTLKDLGSKDSVKNVLLSMATAGALNELGKTNLIGNKALNQITAADGFAANLGKNMINNVASAAMTSALTGASLEDSLKTGLVSAVISAGAGQAANTIGAMTQDSPAVKALAHALAGCVAGAAGTGNSQGCQSGAIGAVVGELAAQWYDPTGLKPKADTLAFVKVISAAAGALTGDGSAASVNTAVMTGVNAAENNYLSHLERKQLTTAQKACLGTGDVTACSTASALKYKDELSDKLLANAVATCRGSECTEVSNFAQKEMAAVGCTAPNSCPDYATLSNFWQVAQGKAQGLVPVYPEGWLLDAKAVLDLGKLGVKAVTSTTGKSSLDALQQLRQVDQATALKVVVENNATRDQDSLTALASMLSDAKQANWKLPSGQTWWPPNNGAVPGSELQATLPKGTLLDRFGGTSDKSSFLAPAETPLANRALSPNTEISTREIYEVLKPMPVEQSNTMPWFGQTGMGIQYDTAKGATGMTIQELVKLGYIKKVTP
jgi:filamentous hemagglutinin